MRAGDMLPVKNNLGGLATTILPGGTEFHEQLGLEDRQLQQP